MKQKQIVIVAIAILIGAFIFGGKYYKDSQSSKMSQMATAEREVFTPEYAPVIGPKEAPVTLVEFYDPACGTCAEFSPLIKDLVKKYDGKLRVVLRYAPLHQNSDQVVMMVEAAKLQGKYFEAKEALFATQSLWVENHVSQPARVWDIFQKAGIDIGKLQEDVKNPEVYNRVKKDMEDAQKVGATKTPAFYVNGKPLQRFGYEPLVALIESEM